MYVFDKWVRHVRTVAKVQDLRINCSNFHIIDLYIFRYTSTEIITGGVMITTLLYSKLLYKT